MIKQLDGSFGSPNPPPGPPISPPYSIFLYMHTLDYLRYCLPCRTIHTRTYKGILAVGTKINCPPIFSILPLSSHFFLFLPLSFLLSYFPFLPFSSSVVSLFSFELLYFSIPVFFFSCPFYTYGGGEADYAPT